MRPIDLAILALYLVGVTVFGCSFYFKKSAKGAAGFVAGGGKVPSWAIGLSIFATLVSSISFLALPAKAFATNWNALVFSFTVPLCAVVAALAFVPLYRNLNSVSAYAFLEKRFGAWARMYGSVCFLVMQTARSGVILYLLALLLKTLFGWSVPMIISVVGLTTCVYSMLGGVLAVIWTDAIQSLVLIAGTILCIGVLVFTMPDGIAAATERIWSEGKLSLGSFSLSEWASETFWVTFIYAVFINLQNLGIDQSYTQRYISAKSVKDAVKSVCFGSFLYLPVTACFVVIGTLLWAYYTGRPGSLPDEIAAVKDSVFPYFIVHSLPVGVTGMLVAAIVAAAMSTVSATLNSGATVIMEDWYKRYFKRDASERACVITLRASTVFLGLASIVIAFAVIGVESALSTWWMLQSVLSGGMLGLFLLGCVSKRVSKGQAAVATVLGVATVAWVVFGQKSLHPNLSIVLGTTVLFVAGLLFSLLGKRLAGTSALVAAVTATCCMTGCESIGGNEMSQHVFDRIENAKSYYSRNPLFEKAFDFVRSHDLKALPVGRYEIVGTDCFAMIQEPMLKIADAAKFEAHHDYIDIQLPISGEEIYGISDTPEEVLAGASWEKGDVALFEAPVHRVSIGPGEFAIFFPPKGAHAPCLTEGAPHKIKKLVIKVRACR